MFVQAVSRRGLSHSERNEDNLFFQKSEKGVIGAVFDGCSTGKDAYFASKLLAILVNKIINGQNLLGNDLPQLELIGEELVRELAEVKKQLFLQDDDLLSTIVFFRFDQSNNQLEVKFLGDGCVCTSNGKFHVHNIDQNNQPNYLIYQLNELLDGKSFQKYWKNLPAFQSKTEDFTVATDGVFTFKNSDPKNDVLDPLEFLAKDEKLLQNPAGLSRKMNILNKKGFQHLDDVTVIRVKN